MGYFVSAIEDKPVKNRQCLSILFNANVISAHLYVISSLALSDGKKQQELKMNVVDRVKLQNQFSIFLTDFQISVDVEATLNTLINLYNKNELGFSLSRFNSRAERPIGVKICMQGFLGPENNLMIV